ncbi:hypothetical protein Rs2_37708 [Raphanus sativus]|nr:hypothetical protein Rs2_37708 [Raphanus sativus]
MEGEDDSPPPLTLLLAHVLWFEIFVWVNDFYAGISVILGQCTDKTQAPVVHWNLNLVTFIASPVNLSAILFLRKPSVAVSPVNLTDYAYPIKLSAYVSSLSSVQPWKSLKSDSKDCSRYTSYGSLGLYITGLDLHRCVSNEFLPHCISGELSAAAPPLKLFTTASPVKLSITDSLRLCLIYNVCCLCLLSVKKKSKRDFSLFDEKHVYS